MKKEDQSNLESSTQPNQLLVVDSADLRTPGAGRKASIIKVGAQL